MLCNVMDSNGQMMQLNVSYDKVQLDYRRNDIIIKWHHLAKF